MSSGDNSNLAQPSGGPGLSPTLRNAAIGATLVGLIAIILGYTTVSAPQGYLVSVAGALVGAAAIACLGVHFARGAHWAKACLWFLRAATLGVFAGYRYVEYLIDTRNLLLSHLKSGLLVVVGLLLVGQALLQFAARGKSLHTWWNKRQSTRQ